MALTPETRPVVRAAVCLIAAILVCQPLPARSQGQWYVSGAVGVMTESTWYRAFLPHDVELADSYMIGGALGWERPIRQSRFRFGVEASLLAHTGDQDHFELSVPVVLRFVPDRNRVVRSVAAGVGLSYATKIPQVEINRNGASQRLFVHWLAEVEFGLSDPGNSVFLRLHHRSDGYGVFEVDAGSTGYLFGVRKRF